MKLIIPVICTIALLSTPALAQKGPSKKATPASSAKAKAKGKNKAKTKAKATARSKKAAPARSKKARRVRCKANEERTRTGCVRVKDVDFGKGDEIDGEAPEGYGEMITGTPNITFAGLIRLRTHFHDKILKSVEGL